MGEKTNGVFGNIGLAAAFALGALALSPVFLLLYSVTFAPLVDDIRSEFSSSEDPQASTPVHRRDGPPRDGPKGREDTKPRDSSRFSQLPKPRERNRFSVRPGPADAAPPPSLESQPGGLGVWECGYAPTVNEDWHDDALCTDGVSRVRPYLLPNDPFVTYAELRRAAAEFEAELNSR